MVNDACSGNNSHFTVDGRVVMMFSALPFITTSSAKNSAAPWSQTAVRACMARATLMCMPCIVGDDGNRDALPTTLIEAGAMELPSISTPVTGIPEILGHGSAGVLVPENDVPATARAIASLLDDPARARALGRAARTRCEELFDGRKSAATLREWFAESMQRG